MENLLSGNESTVSLFIALGLGAAVLFLSSSEYRKQTFAGWPAVPGALPLIGNLLQVSAEKSTIILERWASMYSKDKGFFCFSLLGRTYVVLCRHDIAMEALAQRPFKITRANKLAVAIKSLKADGLFSSEGNDWKADRRLAGPPLNHRNIQSYQGHVRTVIDRLIAKWKAQKGKPFAINEDIFRYNIDKTALTIIGQDFDSLRNSFCMDMENINGLMATIFRRGLAPIPYWKIPFLGKYLDAGLAAERLNQMLEGVMREEEKRAVPSGTFVGKLNKLNKADNSMPRDRILGNLATMFIGGVDTSSSTELSAIFQLCMDKTGLQEQLAEEVLSIDDFEDLSVEDLLQKTPKLQSFMFELQRAHGAAARQLLEVKDENSVKFQGKVLPAGTRIYLLHRFISMNPFEAPPGLPLGPNGEPNTVFCPRRWLNEDGSVVTPDVSTGAFLAFGHGARVCPGRAFAESSSVRLMASLLREFKMKLEDNHPEVGYKFAITEMVDRDVRLELSPRAQCSD